jgi:hypothetical protein
LAGSNPNAEIRTLVRAHEARIEFHPDFTTLDGIVSDRDVFLSPLDHGAGMKVKVADCIGMGAPILGSAETFVGYEALPHVSYLTCRGRGDYLKRLRELSDPDSYASIAGDLHSAWEEHFSMNASTAKFVNEYAKFADPGSYTTPRIASDPSATSS